jgi:cytochrome d ubiquinol oxidase subunit II
MFSAFYTPLMLVLFALILRAVALEFRHQVLEPKWRSLWDWVFSVASFLPGFLLGVAFANIFKGIPIDGEGVFHGNLLDLLSLYGLLGGLLFSLLFCLHGALWPSLKLEEGSFKDRAHRLALALWLPLALTLAAFVILSLPVTALFDNYMDYPALLLIPVAAVAGLAMSRIWLGKAAYLKALLANGLTIAGATFFGVAGLYPNLLPSSFSSAYSLTVVNSASSPLTLKIMLGVVLVFVPLVIGYQAWAYWVLRGKVSSADQAY